MDSLSRGINAREFDFGENFFQFHECLGLWNIIILNVISFYEVHDIECFSILFSVSFGIQWDILVHGVFSLGVSGVIKIEYCLEPLIL